MSHIKSPCTGFFEKVSGMSVVMSGDEKLIVFYSLNVHHFL